VKPERPNIALGLAHSLRSLARSKSGVGAVEFALVMPILLVIYLMAFEFTVAISTGRKVSFAASNVADLVTRQSTVNKAYLTTMYDVSQSVLAPYATTGMALKITGITIDSAAKPTVLWSWKNDGSVPYPAGSVVPVPSNLTIANTFLVHAELSLPYSLLFYLPGMSGTKLQTLNISRNFYFRQRIGSKVACSDC
jgi:Flp pilus assembly protein TadG